MQIRKFRWSKVYESTEEELIELFARKHISSHQWTVEDGEEITKEYSVDTQLWCAEGQLTCTVQGKSYSLQPGDALDVSANMSCNVRGRFGGCVCYESAASQNGKL